MALLPAGFYENQDPSPAEMNLRGGFITDETGICSFKSVKPVGYPIPLEGNVLGSYRARKTATITGQHTFTSRYSSRVSRH